MTKPRPYPAVILALKAFKAARNWSNAEVVDVCAAEGQIVAVGTAKRVFSNGSEAYNFDYTVSLEPLVYVFRKLGAEIPEPDLSVEIKGTSATDLEKALEAIERVHNNELEYLRAQLRRERVQKFVCLGLLVATLILELVLFAAR